MSDRKGGPEEGTPEYNWLYGIDAPQGDDATQVRPPEPAASPDATRMMPAAAPPSGSTPPPTTPTPPTPQARPATPPPSTPRGGSGISLPLPRRPRFRPIRWVTYVVLLWLVFLIATPFWAWTKVSKVEWEPQVDRPEDQPGTTYLLVGSDSREDLTPEERRELGTGAASGQRTDTIMLLHTGDGPNILMSLPRDSLVDVPGYGPDKINAAYAYGGAPLLVRTIEGNTGIRVDHYLEIGLGGFVGLVDAVGGITICPEVAMKDRLANLDIPKGCQPADGKTALGYARARHFDPQYGDISRVQHQREVVAAIGKEVISPWTFINPVRYWRVNFGAAETFKAGEGTGPVAMANFAWAIRRVSGDTGLTCVVPISDLAVHWDPQRSRQMFDLIIADDADTIMARKKSLCTPKGLPR